MVDSQCLGEPKSNASENYSNASDLSRVSVSQNWTRVSDERRRLLESVCVQLRDELPVKDRKWMGMTYRSCLDAKEMTDWLAKHMFSGDRKQAVELGRALQKQKYIVHVWGSHTKVLPFADTTMYFRFTSTVESLVASDVASGAANHAVPESDDDQRQQCAHQFTNQSSGEAVEVQERKVQELARFQEQSDLDEAHTLQQYDALLAARAHELATLDAVVEARREEERALREELEVKAERQKALAHSGLDCEKDIQIKQADSELDSLTHAIETKRKEHQELHEALDAKRKEQVDLDASLRDRLQALDATLDDHEGTLESKRKQLEELDITLAAKREEQRNLEVSMEEKRRAADVGQTVLRASLEAKRQELNMLEAAVEVAKRERAVAVAEVTATERKYSLVSTDSEDEPAPVARPSVTLDLTAHRDVPTGGYTDME